jgi:pimeloyl-ACP methyl ester carboxylesterase
VHGYVHEMAVWHYQRQALQAAGDVRVVLYDQRAHGRSSRGAPERSTIDQLGHDLGRVLDEVVPTGPVVLVGHSMGGMTLMALADGRPELFGDRVVGVALLSTSAGRLAQVSFGLPTAALPVTRRVIPVLTRGMSTRPRHFERGRRAGSDLVFLFTRRGGFGSSDVSPALVEFVATMGARTPVDVIAEFYDTFMAHDKLSAIDVLRDVEVLVLVGDHDLMTPPDHSRDIAAALPDARLVVVEDAGHMVLLEHPEQVDQELLDLLARVRARRAAA